MNGFNVWMEDNFVPVASKLAAQRHLAAIRDAFIAMMPVTLAGSFAVLLNVFFRDIPTSFFPESEKAAAFVEAMAPIININGIVWWATIAMMGLIFSFSFGYNLALHAKVDPLPAGIVSIAVFIATIPQVTAIPDGLDAGLWGYIGSAYTGAAGLFTALIFVLLSFEIYRALVLSKFTIKMPDGVPPNVSKAFLGVIPGIAAIFGTAIVIHFVGVIFETPVNDLISQVIQQPLLNLSQGAPAVIIVTLVTQLLWFFGIHGMNTLTPIYETMWGVAQIENMEAVAQGLEPAYLWVRGSFDIYSMMGGSGVTIGLLIAMFMFGKREETKVISRIGIGPGIFNINEPLVFGVPIVLNPVYFIPWIIIPTICVVIGYFATWVGFAGPVVAAVPWVTPPLLNAFLATGGNIGAVIISAVCLVVAIILWIPAVILAERMADKAEREAK